MRYFEKQSIRIKFLGAGTEGSAYKVGDKVIKQIRSSRPVEELNKIVGQVKQESINPYLKTEWPKVVEYKNKKFTVTNYVKGPTVEEVAWINKKIDLSKKVNRRLFRELDQIKSNKREIADKAYLGRVTRKGLTRDEANSAKRFFHDRAPSNFIVSDKGLVQIDPGMFVQDTRSGLADKMFEYYKDAPKRQRKILVTRSLRKYYEKDKGLVAELGKKIKHGEL